LLSGRVQVLNILRASHHLRAIIYEPSFTSHHLRAIIYESSIFLLCINLRFFQFIIHISTLWCQYYELVTHKHILIKFYRRYKRFGR